MIFKGNLLLFLRFRLKAQVNDFNICFNINSILLNAVGRLSNDVERWDERTVSTFHSTKLRE